MENLDDLLTVRQVAFILKIHPLTVRRYIKEGKLKAVKIGGNVRIKESTLQDASSKDFSPKPSRPSGLKSKNPIKIFTEYDPLLRLRGRGASLSLSS